MRSVFFGMFLRDTKSPGASRFMRDVGALLALDEGALAGCLDALPEMMLARSAADQRRVAERVATQCQVGLDKVSSSLNAMKFLLDGLLRTDIPASDAVHWADDLAEAEALNASNRGVFERVLSQIKSSVLSQVRPKLRRQRAAAGVFPSFTGAGYTVEVRAVREEPFRRGMPIDDYVPQVVDTTTVASFHLSVDEGTVTEFYFQADEADIDYLLGVLQAAKKEMEALKGFLRISQS